MLAFRSILTPGPERWTPPPCPGFGNPIEVKFPFQAVLFAIRVSPGEGGGPIHLFQKVRRFISKNRNVRAVSLHVPNYLVPDCFLIQSVSLEVADSCIFQMDQQTTDFRRYHWSKLSESWFPMSFRPTLSQSAKASFLIYELSSGQLIRSLEPQNGFRPFWTGIGYGEDEIFPSLFTTRAPGWPNHSFRFQSLTSSIRRYARTYSKEKVVK
ncbi:hypothetical protein Acr_00g0001650 [Actinidia rufa]|uniref:Uncharacterized protein n=1 Tax=Actinidia rufa TaxID=165716 RepID=A0A7J0D8D4_9ERIC|nr:hypothetical protein Acr_00g0001650 [Actinidia rufa]